MTRRNPFKSFKMSPEIIHSGFNQGRSLSRRDQHKSKPTAVLTEGIVLPVRTHAEIVAVDMRARRDRLGRHPDGPTVAHHRRPLGRVRQGDLVAAPCLGAGDG